METAGEPQDRPDLSHPHDDAGLDRVYSIDVGLLGLSERTAGARLADVGCGPGRHELATARLPITTVACDLSWADLRAGRYFVGEDRKGGRWPGTVTWVRGAASSLPLADGSLDAAICSETLEHIEDDVGVLKELRRVVRNGGTLAVSVPAHAVEFVLWQLSWEVTHTRGGHIRIYRQEELLAKLRATGWEPYAVRRRHAFESVYWLLAAAGGRIGAPGAPARAWRRITNSRGVRNSGVWNGLERWLSRWVGKSLVVYARAA